MARAKKFKCAKDEERNESIGGTWMKEMEELSATWVSAIDEQPPFSQSALSAFGCLAFDSLLYCECLGDTGLASLYKDIEGSTPWPVLPVGKIGVLG